jgi:predicted metalloprotease
MLLFRRTAFSSEMIKPILCQSASRYKPTVTRGFGGNTTAQRNIVSESDVEAPLNAAAAVRDDRLNEWAARISPETFTHGSLAQRVHWFKLEFDSVDPSACNTFRTE